MIYDSLSPVKTNCHKPSCVLFRYRFSSGLNKHFTEFDGSRIASRGTDRQWCLVRVLPPLGISRPPWRLFDTLNDRWYDDDLYVTQSDCIAACQVYMHEARIVGDDLRLAAGPIDLHEPFESIAEEGDPSC